MTLGHVTLTVPETQAAREETRQGVGGGVCVWKGSRDSTDRMLRNSQVVCIVSRYVDRVFTSE